jgi:hypothetical protein
MDLVAKLRAKADTNLGWLVLFSLTVLSSLITIFSALGDTSMIHLLKFSIDPLLIAAAINTVITLIAVYWGYTQKRERGASETKLLEARKVHRQELDAATKALEDLTDKYDTTKRELDEARKSLNDLTHKCENKELELLIQPLFLAFDKYPDDPIIMQREKFGLPMKWSLMSPTRSPPSHQVEKVDSIISAMQQYGNLAQPELKGLIRELLEFRQIQEAKGRFSSIDPYFTETADKVDKIAHLAAVRYNELMWGKKEN